MVKRQTAKEFIDQLNADPDYQRRMAEKERRRAKRQAAIDAAERPILADLREIGVDLTQVSDLVNFFPPLPPNVVRILLEWLPRITHDNVLEMAVRALGATEEPYDGRPLVGVFERTKSESVRWAIANTMAEARPTGISDWLREATPNRSSGMAREMLCLAVARLVLKDQAIPVLMSVLDDLPGHAARAIGEIGQQTELPRLRSKLPETSGWQRKELARAIRKIERR